MATGITADTDLAVTKSRSIASKSSAYPFWAWTGAIFIAVELYTWLSWIFGPNFVRTPPGDDPISQFEMNILMAWQIGVPILGAACIWYWVIRPWRREGRMTTDGMLALSMMAIVIYDPVYNYASTGLFYNSHAVNFGAWTLGSMPGWISPNGNLLPEPILITIPGYLALVFGQAVFTCWVLRKYKARRPQASVYEIVFAIVIALTIIDSVLEMFLIRTGVYAYPAGIEGLTFFYGETYQFPIYEGVLFGGLAIGATAVMMFYKNDKGEAFVERGIEATSYSPLTKQWLRFCALFGYVHLAFFLLYLIPMNWFTLQADHFPEGYPSYMENNMCVYGIEQNQCPGPGVMMPRLEK